MFQIYKEKQRGKLKQSSDTLPPCSDIPVYNLGNILFYR